MCGNSARSVWGRADQLSRAGAGAGDWVGGGEGDAAGDGDGLTCFPGTGTGSGGRGWADLLPGSGYQGPRDLNPDKTRLGMELRCGVARLAWPGSVISERCLPYRPWLY